MTAKPNVHPASTVSGPVRLLFADDVRACRLGDIEKPNPVMRGFAGSMAGERFGRL